MKNHICPNPKCQNKSNKDIKLYDKKSIVIGAQKRSIELERFKLLLCIAALFFQDDKSLEPIFLQRVIWQHCNVYLPLVF